MGRNLAYNMGDHNFSVIGFDKDAGQVKNFTEDATQENIKGTTNLAEFVSALSVPRKIIVLVPAGKIVDAVIEELKPLLSANDLIIDCGNSHYKDTNRRFEQLSKDGIHFMGVGVSGGEQGARYGPSIMPGGNREMYNSVAPMLEALSAKVGNEACVAWLGNGAAGHYVKMAHNGIEYALMQLLAETYHLLKHGANMSNEELQQLFNEWNKGPLKSFLLEITANIFAQKDDLADGLLIDSILDTAHQKGTGAWTSEDALALGVPVPVIDAAVTARNLSSRKAERVQTEKILEGPKAQPDLDRNELIRSAEQALYFSMITTFAQGMALLQQASTAYNFNLNLSEVARIWRGGCIIRAALLEKIKVAYIKKHDNLILNATLAKELDSTQAGIRNIIGVAVKLGIPLPCYAASLTYYDAFRSGWLPANLIQAQRDYFGAHTYERTDRTGTFHTNWQA